MVIAVPIRRRLSLRGAPGVVAEDQAFVAAQVPLDTRDPVQTAWNGRQWRDLGLYVQGLEARIRDLQARLAAIEGDTWDGAP